MSGPPAWRPLIDAALRANPTQASARYAQLATVRPDGRPANRTVVFRGFLPDGRLTFTTDTRSEKAGDLERLACAELCWSFTATREQFRLLGPAAINLRGLDTRRFELWHELPESSRQTFVWPQPGAPRSPDEAFRRPVPADPPPNFGLLILSPDRVDHLDLRPHPHARTVYTDNGVTWDAEPVNP